MSDNPPTSRGFSFGALTSKKVAGIPVVWIVLGIAVVALYAALQLKPVPEATDDTEEDVPEGDSDISGDSVDTSVPVFSATPVIYQPSGGASSIASTPQEDTNELWGKRSVDYLISPAGGFTVGLASTAISKYLEGDSLSMEEARARDSAIRQFGLPPEGILPTNNPAAPVTPASKQGVPPLLHTVRNSRDNTAPELARLYYGPGPEAVGLIRYANQGKQEPYPVGTKVRIVKFREPRYYRATSATRTADAIARKNGVTSVNVRNLNPGMKFPVKAGTRVRVK